MSSKPSHFSDRPLHLLRKIGVKEAAELNDVSEDTFKRNYSHLIKKVGLRRNVVTLGDAIDLPTAPRAVPAK